MDKVKDDVVRAILDAATTGKHSDAVKALDEYATQQSRIDAIGFLKWFKDDSIIFFDDNGEMYNSLTDEFLSHEQVYELYLLSINKK